MMSFASSLKILDFSDSNNSRVKHRDGKLEPLSLFDLRFHVTCRASNFINEREIAEEIYNLKEHIVESVFGDIVSVLKLCEAIMTQAIESINQDDKSLCLRLMRIFFIHYPQSTGTRGTLNNPAFETLATLSIKFPINFLPYNANSKCFSRGFAKIDLIYPSLYSLEENHTFV